MLAVEVVLPILLITPQMGLEEQVEAALETKTATEQMVLQTLEVAEGVVDT
jgi:hypothetical protein